MEDIANDDKTVVIIRVAGTDRYPFNVQVAGYMLISMQDLCNTTLSVHCNQQRVHQRRCQGKETCKYTAL